jgi:predicted nucleic acid-binding protein
MTDVVLLDAGPLGMVSHPRASVDIVEWLARLVSSGIEVMIPEVADYEVRRELLRAGRKRGVERLDELRVGLGFVPITSDAMLRAAACWADARRRGRATASDQSLDADVILAGQAATLGRGEVVVASSNPRHIARFVPSRHWRDIPVRKSS